MAFDISAASNIMKVRYIGTIREQLNNDTILLNKVKAQTQPVSGKNFTIPLHTGRNANAGIGRADGGTLATAGQQAFENTIAPVKYLYTRGKVTGPTIAATRDNMGAFVQALESETDRGRQDHSRAINRQYHSDGTDALAFWTTADDTSGTNVDDGQGNAFSHLPKSGTITADLIDASDHSTVLGNDIVVTQGAKAATNYAITWTGTVSGSADGDYLVAYNSLGNQSMGIRGIIDNADPPLGDLQQLDSTTYAGFWQAQVFGNSGTNRQLQFEDIQEVIDAVEENSEYKAADVSFLLSNYGVRRAYYALARAERRQVNEMTLDGGFKALMFSGIPWVVDNQCRRNVVYFVNPKTMARFQMAELDFFAKHGSYLWPVDGEDAYQFLLFEYSNLVCLSRNGNGLLEDLTEA